MSTFQTAHRSSAGRTAKLFGLVLLVLGIVVGALGITETVRKVSTAFVDTFSGPVFTTPGDVQLQLHQTGTYLIMQDTTYRNNPSTNFAVAAVRPGDVALMGPDGRELVVAATGGHTRVSRNSAEYFDILKFNASRAGAYRLSVFEPSGVRLIVAPSLGESFGRSARWLAVSGLGLACFFLGAVLLIVGFYSAHKAENLPGASAAYPALPPPGWYPDPARPGASRWWDGRAWRQ